MTIKNPISFNWETRSVIAMIFMGYRDHKEIGAALSCEKRHLRSLGKFVEKILTSKNRVLTTCLRHGMPSTCTVEVPFPNLVRCKSCGSSVFVIPCVNCSARSWDPGEMKPPTGKPTKPKEPTPEPPGSPGKVEVMRERVSRGESPFHDGDAIKLR